MSTRKKTHSAGDVSLLSKSGREAVELVRCVRAEGSMPLVVQVGEVRLELAPIPVPTKLTPPTRDDGRKLLKEYGGEALEELLDDPEMNELEPVQ